MFAYRLLIIRGEDSIQVMDFLSSQSSSALYHTLVQLSSLYAVSVCNYLFFANQGYKAQYLLIDGGAAVQTLFSEMPMTSEQKLCFKMPRKRREAGTKTGLNRRHITLNLVLIINIMYLQSTCFSTWFNFKNILVGDLASCLQSNLI